MSHPSGRHQRITHTKSEVRTMVDEIRLQQLDAQVRALKQADHYADAAGLLEEALAGTEDAEEKLYFLSCLASEHQLFGRYQAAEDVIKKQIEIAAERPEAWLQLAALYHGFLSNAPRALSTVNIAVEKAVQTGDFVRQAYAERIRIALTMQEFGIVENSLTALIGYRPKPGSIDVALESDFLQRIPSGAVSSELVERYRAAALRKSHKGD